MSDKPLSIKEAAGELGVHRDTIKHAINTGEIEANKIGGRYYIPAKQIKDIVYGTKKLNQHTS
jgi:excisionase family DNA binding protein